MFLLLGLGLFGVGGFALLASRRGGELAPDVKPPAQPQPQGQQPQQPQPQGPAFTPPASGLPAPSTVTVPGRAQSGAPAPESHQPSEADEQNLVQKLGEGLGTIAGLAGAQDTQKAKDLAPAIGGGVALAAYLANVGGVAAASGLSATLGAFAVIALPLLEITYAIVVIVDQVCLAVEAEQWREMARNVRRLREAGQFSEAITLFYKVTQPQLVKDAQVRDATGQSIDLGSVHVEFKGISPKAIVWPQPGEDWYNASDPLGRPYAGFPGAPAPATRGDVARWPSLVPDEVTFSGPAGMVNLSPAAVLSAAYADVVTVRDQALALGIPGVNAAGQTVTVGPRDIRDFAPYKERLTIADGWARKFAAGVPWLAGDALLRDVRIPVEVARDQAKASAARAAKDAATSARVARAIADEPAPTTSSGKVIKPSPTTPATRTIGYVPPPPAPVVVIQSASTDTTAQQRTNSANRSEAGADGARTGATGPSNRSGSGGRNG